MLCCAIIHSLNLYWQLLCRHGLIHCYFYCYDLVASKMGAYHVYTRIIYSRFTPHLQRSVLVLAQGVHHTIRHAKKMRAESIGLCAKLLHG
jgi:hypothetical protein